MIWLLLIFTACFQTLEAEQTYCNAKDFGSGSVACKCTEEYCDTFEPSMPSDGQYLYVTSTKCGLRFQAYYGDIQQTQLTENDHILDFSKQPHALFTLNRTATRQTIMGFGGAFTDSAGFNLDYVTPGLKEKYFEAYFSKKGLQYNMGRVPIGHTDFSLSEYYYSETQNDVNMTDWRLHEADKKFKIPHILRAKSMTEDELLLVSSVWTVPRWMRHLDDSAGLTTVIEEYYDALALYIIKFLDAYKDNGIKIMAVNYANEPTLNLIAPVADYVDKMFTVWPFNKLAQFAAQVLAPKLKECGYNDTKILFFDDDRIPFFPPWISCFMNQNGIKELVELVGTHSYMNDFMNGKVIDDFHEKYPNATILTTEFCAGHDEGVKLGSWNTAEFYVKNMIDEMLHHTSGWIDWNMNLDTEGKPTFVGNKVDAPVIFDLKNNAFYKQPSYFAMGHFSKFMPRGSIGVDVEAQIPTVLQQSAVQRPDGRVAVVLFSQCHFVTEVTILDGDRQIKVDIMPDSISTIVF